MAKRKISDEELISRREFFRKGAQAALPMLVSIALPSIITSCTPDDDWGCSECSSICSYTCHESCSSTSTSSSCDSCSSSCVNSCSGTCSTTCEGSSQSSSCSGCSNSCSGDCAESCGNSCGNNCSSSCKNSSSGSGNEDNDSVVSSASGSIDGYEYVDLGLSVKWARCNYGASSPSSNGSYEEFTDGATGNDYVEVTASLLKAGYAPGDSIAGSSFDSVSQHWGNKWRMPSKTEFEELINNSNIEQYELNNVIGIKITSKKNGKSIFLPCAGRKGDDSKYPHGYYWTSVLSSIQGRGASAYYFWWGSSDSGIWGLTINFDPIAYYENQMTIRPVTDGGNNPSTCNNSCTATCANNSTGSGCSSCGSNCSSSCGSNCSGACVNTCNTGCGKQCRHSCGGTCSQTCAGFCSGGCKGASKGSCSDCTGSCSYLCSKSCSQYCYSSCTNMGVKSL